MPYFKDTEPVGRETTTAESDPFEVAPCSPLAATDRPGWQPAGRRLPGDPLVARQLGAGELEEVQALPSLTAKAGLLLFEN